MYKCRICFKTVIKKHQGIIKRLINSTSIRHHVLLSRYEIRMRVARGLHTTCRHLINVFTVLLTTDPE